MKKVRTSLRIFKNANSLLGNQDTTKCDKNVHTYNKSEIKYFILYSRI